MFGCLGSSNTKVQFHCPEGTFNPVASLFRGDAKMRSCEVGEKGRETSEIKTKRSVNYWVCLSQFVDVLSTSQPVVFFE